MGGSSLPPAERSTSRGQGRGGARAALRMAFLALAAFLIFLAGISMFQDNLLYYPRRAVDWPHSSIHRYLRLGLLNPDWASAARDEGGFGE